MRRVLAIVFALALVIAACGGDDEATSEEDTATTVAGTETTAATDTETTAEAPETTAASETTAAAETTDAPETTQASDDALALASAIGMSSEAQSGRLEGSMTMVGAEGFDPGTEVTMEFSGEFDNATGNSSFIMDMSDMAGATGDELPPEFADLFGEMEMRTIGDTSYIRFGLFAMFGAPTEWVSFPVEEGGDTAASFGASPTNPMEFMDALSNAGTDFENLGSDTVREMNTTHYRVIMDTTAMLEEADPDAAAELEGLGATYFDTLPVDFWIGDDGNMYRMMMDIDGTADPTSGFESMTMVWEMFDYGADITIEAPPADQVTDGTELAGMIPAMTGE